MSKRLSILQAVQSRLETLGLPVLYLEDIDFEYGQDAIHFRDEANYEASNLVYESKLLIEVKAVKYSPNWLADGEALRQSLFDLIRDQSWDGNAIKTRLVSDYKQAETKGKKAVLVTLNFEVTYRG